jgi:hypothetical protein
MYILENTGLVLLEPGLTKLHEREDDNFIDNKEHLVKINKILIFLGLSPRPV